MTFIYRHRDVNKDIREEYTKKYISKVSIDVIATYPLGAVDDDDMNKVFKDTLNIRSKENYDNSYIVTSIDMNTSLNVIYVSPLNKKVDSNLKTLIRSLLVVNKGDKYIYSHLCPICGSHITPIDNEGEYKCPICSSTYSLFKKDNNNDEVSNVWFKKVNSKPNIE